MNGRATYRCVKLDRVLRYHRCNSLVRTVAAVVTGIHLSVLTPPNVLQTDDTVRHVQLVVAAAGWVHDYHNRDSLEVLVADQAGALVWVVRVKLDQVRPVPQLALHAIVQLVYQIFVVVLAVSLHHRHIRKKIMNIKIII